MIGNSEVEEHKSPLQGLEGKGSTDMLQIKVPLGFTALDEWGEKMS